MSNPKLQNDNALVLVDDDDAISLICKLYLRQSKLNNPLLSFLSGVEFLTYMEGVKTGVQPMPALVLLDINMPEMNGFEVLRRMRSDPSFTQLPMVMMFSNSDALSDKKKAMELGANGYQTKPSETKEFIEFLNSLSGKNP